MTHPKEPETEISSLISEDAGVFYPPDSIPERDLIGYEKQMDAGLSLGLNVCEGGFKSVLLFGSPGTGKGIFPQALAFYLNKKHSCNFSFLKLHCERLLVDLIVSNNLEKFFLTVTRLIEKHRPIMIVLDELETLNYRHNTMNSSTYFFNNWIISLLSKHPENVMVIGISNYPNNINNTLLNRFCVPIYFDITTKEIIDKIIKTFLDDPRHEEITKKLIEKLASIKINPASSEVITSCKQIRNLDLDIKNMSVDDIVNFLILNISPISSLESIDEYRNNTKKLIELSENYTIPYWSRRRARVLKKKPTNEP